MANYFSRIYISLLFRTLYKRLINTSGLNCWRILAVQESMFYTHSNRPWTNAKVVQIAYSGPCLLRNALAILPAVSASSLNSRHDHAVGVGAVVDFHQLAVAAGSAREEKFAQELGGKG
jgi:hypothetical protein